MIQFVDPRTNPAPPARVSRELAAHGEELRELITYCLSGRVYDAEQWIQAGRSIQALDYKRPKRSPVLSPLRAAVRKNHADVVLLLLCNGYRLDLEPADGDTVLDEALRIRAFDIVDLLLKWGADPTKVEACNVVDTYQTDLIDRFWKAGVDYSVDPSFVMYLAETANKPLYGWLRRYRSDQRLQDALDVALYEAVIQNKEKVVHLLRWAGADPHRKVPSARDLGEPDAWAEDMVSSSAETAITFGRHELFGVLHVATMPDLDAQFPRVHDAETLKQLLAICQPSDWSGVIVNFLRELRRTFLRDSTWDARAALEFIGTSGGRLTAVPPDELRWLRGDLLATDGANDFLWALRWLRQEKHCDPAIYADLIRTPSMKGKMEALNAGGRTTP